MTDKWILYCIVENICTVCEHPLQLLEVSLCKYCREKEANHEGWNEGRKKI